ncbi:ABC transporter permease [Ligilactobacillus sp. WILCCON 0076]|uniref:Putative hemin transport system permease protein HrtB n=1 Tax=Ligilactobacillus ubinensis TaxID=2876789 RepID=A0A9X2JM67_9LACO|nr:ABC transporter permease [Ligilactobacillus ubinensis]MCP0886816.1 ABC transporter permease [Ligilactobacillus ubinensis]
MFLAFKEIKHEKLRYALITAMILMISYLIFILTSLALGLANENTSGIYSWNFKHIILNADANTSLSQSLLTANQISAQKITNKEALIGQASVVVKKAASSNVDANFVGIKSNQFIYKDLQLSLGHLPKNDQQIVVDSSFRNSGYHLNDWVTLNSNTKKYQIVGFVKNAQYNMSPIIYGRLTAWSSLKNVSPTFKASAIISRKNYYTAKTKKTASYSTNSLIQKLPGYSAQNTTFSLMIAFLLIISLIIVTVFLYIITIQKIPNYAVLRAQGIPASILVKSTISQAISLVGAGLTLGIFFTWITTVFIPKSAPMSFNIPLLSLVALSLIVTSILGTLLPIKAILHVDPITIIGG